MDKDGFSWYNEDDLILPKNRDKHNLAKVGDTIQWSFPNTTDYPKHFRGNTFEAKVQDVNHSKKEYGVYSEYGVDKIPFNDCKIIKRK